MHLDCPAPKCNWREAYLANKINIKWREASKMKVQVIEGGP